MNHVPLAEEDQHQLENGGGISEATKKDRESVYDSFAAWILANKGDFHQ